MLRLTIFLMPFFMLSACESGKITQKDDGISPPVTLVIHGGAGTIRKGTMSSEREEAYHAALRKALESGYAVLNEGGTSVEAVVTSIAVLEDSPLFNAGKGAVFTDEGTNELDASLMDGSDLNAGAVAGVTMVKNPIKAAFAVMTQSEHVMLSGRGAEAFAKEKGLEIVDPKYFRDSARFEQYLRRKAAQQTGDAASAGSGDGKFGTVGAVALDSFGNLAAGTSTGGMSNKKWGRIGDSPIIGAGTYADNRTCAVSSTGWGEYFIRLAVAHDISAMMQYAGVSLAEAADSVIMKKLPALGGDGGIIAVDSRGNISMTFNTEGMFRGFIQEKGKPQTFIFKEDKQ